MGGQSCVLYGGAEFSRDTDLAVLPDPENLARLQSALDDLEAECIAVPPFEKRFLDMGLAVHFRCRRADALGMRVDVMAKMRGVEPFAALWDRRTTVDLDGESVDLLSLPDLVKAKKTQRDKDWLVLPRLVEASYFENRDAPTPPRVDFWLRELRTPELLVEAAASFARERTRVERDRPLLALAEAGREDEIRRALRDEEDRERDADRQYWKPLRAELERLRAARHARPPAS